MDTGLLGATAQWGERAACRLGCMGASHLVCACAYATIPTSQVLGGYWFKVPNSDLIRNSDMSDNTGTLGFTKIPQGFPQVLMMSRFMAEVRVRFVALLSSAGVNAEQELVRQVLVRGST